MNIPYTRPGIGWILAVVVLVLAILGLISDIHVNVLWLIIGLALAMLL